jgi:hypothetical protein
MDSLFAQIGKAGLQRMHSLMRSTQSPLDLREFCNRVKDPIYGVPVMVPDPDDPETDCLNNEWLTAIGLSN